MLLDFLWQPSHVSSFFFLCSTSSELSTSSLSSSTMETSPVPGDPTLTADFFTTEVLVGIAAGIGGILLILLIVIIWLCCRNSRNNSNRRQEKKDVESDGGGGTTDANENFPGERSKLMASSTGALSGGGPQRGGGTASLAASTPTSDSNLDSMLGKSNLLNSVNIYVRSSGEVCMVYLLLRSCYCVHTPTVYTTRLLIFRHCRPILMNWLLVNTKMSKEVDFFYMRVN